MAQTRKPQELEADLFFKIGVDDPTVAVHEAGLRP